MSRSLSPSIRYLYCIPPHTHALLRYSVQAVTASHVAYFAGSGVAVDKETGELLPGLQEPAAAGPLRIVGMDRVDRVRSWEGVPPEETVYYSSVDSYRQLHDLTLVKYGLQDLDDVDLLDDSLSRLRRRMMAAHPDHGGSAESFAAARAAYEAARRRITGEE